ncbi:hypothetical protein EDB81DRAFT_247283 [Dactylonectria macrodidyma]|uniref:Uncharacterized protein n=1 Tax=Dactylonectria macrodidyma TaxID=307937 RepID=A0A9P9IDZ0_9HYPO|nr:hypothetical protein EDB81DRAFT_247283 [Dactylonectria macrodidyma]
MSPSDDDVVYLGTITHRNGSLALACPTTAAADRTDNHTHRAKRLRVSDSRRRHNQPIIPVEIRNKSVALGWVQNWDKSTTPPVMFGFFDRAGRFRRRRGHEGPDSAMEGPLPVSIAHDKVQYRPRFQGMSEKQVRDDLLRRLIQKVGPCLGPGEI